jgi:hypothetical protein
MDIIKSISIHHIGLPSVHQRSFLSYRQHQEKISESGGLGCVSVSWSPFSTSGVRKTVFQSQYQLLLVSIGSAILPSPEWYSRLFWLVSRH